MTSAANSCTQSRTWITSSLRSRENVMSSPFGVSSNRGGLLWRTERADGVVDPGFEEAVVVDVAGGMACQRPQCGGVRQ